MARPGADMREAELLQKLTDIARMKVDAEPLGDDALEIDPSPAHDAVLFTIRPGLDDLRKLRLLLPDKRGLGPAVQLSMRPRPGGVEAMHRVAQRLAVHAADLGCSFSVHPVPDRSSDRSRRLWLTSSTDGPTPEAPSPNNPLAI